MMDSNNLQETPNDGKAEKVAIGAIFLDNALFPQVLSYFGQSGDVIFSPLHKRVWRGMVECYQKQEPISAITVGSKLKAHGTLDGIGGYVTLTNLTHGLPHFSSVQTECKYVVDAWIARETIKSNSQCIAELYDNQPVHEAINRHEQRLSKLRERVLTSNATPLRQLLEAQKLYQIAKSKGEVKAKGLSTKFEMWDTMLGGLNKTDLIYVGARVSMGKTSLALDLCRNICVEDSKRVVAYFSLEQSKEQLAEKLAVGEGMLSGTRFREGIYTKDEWLRYEEATDVLKEYNIIVDDTASLSASEVHSRALRIKQQYKRLDAIVIDQINPMTDDATGGDSRARGMGKTSQKLKAMAKELDVPVICLCQLGRGVEDRKPPIPILSDIKESGDLEQDADQVVFIYREDYYYPETQNKGVAKIIVAKNRRGARGSFEIAWRADSATFRNYAPLTRY